jgi:Zn-dependent protease
MSMFAPERSYPDSRPPELDQHGYRIVTAPESAPPRRSPARRLGGGLAAAAAFLAKFGAILYKLKFVTVAGSMLVSIGAYALLGGWWFGVGLVALIFFHEMGHVLALRRQGVRASAPLFIPFMGAVIGMRGMPKNAWREAEIALAGPALGSIAAAVVWGIGAYEHSNFLVALAFVGFFINLFNLIPMVPLDGGRAVAALHPAFWLAGLAGLVIVEIARPSPILPLIIIVGLLELRNRWRQRKSGESAAYYSVKPWQRLVVGSAYLGLAAVLVLAMSATHVPHSF